MCWIVRLRARPTASVQEDSFWLRVLTLSLWLNVCLSPLNLCAQMGCRNFEPHASRVQLCCARISYMVHVGPSQRSCKWNRSVGGRESRRLFELGSCRRPRSRLAIVLYIYIHIHIYMKKVLHLYRDIDTSPYTYIDIYIHLH